MPSLNADMAPEEFASALQALDLSRAQAAALFRCSYRSISHWLSGGQKVPTSMAMALRLMVVGGVSARDQIALEGPSGLQRATS